MKEIELNKLVEIALEQKENEWHFHFLTPHCTFNDSSMYKIILEVQDETYSSSLDHKPLEELKKLENHFYRKGK